MLEASSLNKYKVSINEIGKNTFTKYFANMAEVMDYIKDLQNISENDFDGDSINIEKLIPMDYFPSGFTNANVKEENLWMGEFVHFHNLPNKNNVQGTLYSKRFICLVYGSGFDPVQRVARKYVAHMFLPKLNSQSESYELQYKDYLKEISPVTMTIHSTDDEYNDIGIVSTITLPLHELFTSAADVDVEKTNTINEDIMDLYIRQFADMYNPYVYLRTLKKSE